MRRTHTLKTLQYVQGLIAYKRTHIRAALGMKYDEVVAVVNGFKF